MLLISISIKKKKGVVKAAAWCCDLPMMIPDTMILKVKNFIRNPGFNRPGSINEPLNGYLILGKRLYLNPKNFQDHGILDLKIL